MLIAALLLLIATPAPQVELKLLMFNPNDPTSSFELQLVNRGSTPVTLVAPGDGSEEGMRTPMVSWNVALEGEEPLPRDRRARCGNRNTVRSEEIFSLKPGESRRLTVGRPRFPVSGRYRITVTYENAPGRVLSGIASPRESLDVLTRLRASTPLLVTSNPIVLDVPQEPAEAPLLDGEISDAWIERIGTCFGWSARDSSYTDQQRRLIDKLWSRCVDAAGVDALRAAEHARLVAALAHRDLTLVDTVPEPESVPADATHTDGFARARDGRLWVDAERAHLPVVATREGAARLINFDLERRAFIARCDVAAVPEPRRSSGSARRVLSNLRTTRSSTSMTFAPIELVELPRPPPQTDAEDAGTPR